MHTGNTEGTSVGGGSNAGSDPAVVPISSSRSVEFIKGYNACAAGISRTQNPYKVDREKPLEDQFEAVDWRNGWNKRFYGEDINSEP